ncbi:MAG: hypothetical protein AB8B73_16095 [Ekhidna sp.]
MIIVIDDKVLFRQRWVRKLQKSGEKVLSYTHPKKFDAAIEEGDVSPGDIELMVVDRKNGRFDAVNTDYANSFKSLYKDFHGKIVLSSAVHEEYEPPKDGFDYITNKNTKTLEELQKLIAEAAS